MTAQNVGVRNILDILIELSHLYFSKYLEPEQDNDQAQLTQHEPEDQTIEVLQCPNCLNAITTGTEDANAHEDDCSVCGTPSSEFVKVQMSQGVELSIEAI